MLKIRTPFNALLPLLLVAVIVNIMLDYHTRGIEYPDSLRYLEQAEKIKNADLNIGDNLWSIGYSAFVFVAYSIYGNTQFISAVQIFIYLLGVAALFFAALNWFKQTGVAVIACLLYVCWYETSFWNHFILTESLFLSTSCFMLWALSGIEEGSIWKKYLPAFGVLVVHLSIRPTGIVMLLAFLVFVVSNTRQSLSPMRVIILFVLAGGLLLAINTMLYDYDLIATYAQGEIVFLADKTNYKELVLVANRPLTLPGPNMAPLLKPLVFFIDNPLYMLKLMALKAFYFLGRVRPYYSILHNVLLITLFVPTYIMTIWVLLRNSVPGKATKSFLVTYVLGTLGMICLTVTDWDGRFFLPLIPMLFLLSGVGCNKLLTVLYPHFSRFF